jgi:hypothetical protein
VYSLLKEASEKVSYLPGVFLSIIRVDFEILLSKLLIIGLKIAEWLSLTD